MPVLVVVAVAGPISAADDGSGVPTTSAVLRTDFNGDGFDDLAIGVPGEQLGGVGTGAVNVIYGSPLGLSAAGNQFWSQDSPGVRGSGESPDGFGNAVAGGDFDDDGYADLAIGVSGEDLGGAQLAGAVNVLYGSANGLTTEGNQFWSQASPGVPGVIEEGDEFGGSLASGDFNADGLADLAVGAGKEAIGFTPAAGSVTILYGTPDGLSGSNAEAFDQASAGGLVDSNNIFSEALATGDVDGDGYHDLAVTAPGRVYAGDVSGEAHLLFGGPSGLSAQRGQVWSQDSAGVVGGEEPGDEFGASVTIGDFDNDGYGDLAVGVRGEGFGDCEVQEPPEVVIVPCTLQGAVNVLRGSATGLTAAGDQLWHKGSPGVPGALTEGDQFGLDIASADFDGDGDAELAVASDDSGTGGSVYVLQGSPAGLTSTGLQQWSQASAGVPGVPEVGDGFGSELQVGRYASGSRDALVAGAPQEDIGSQDAAGAVTVLYGTGSGLTSANARGWTQDTTGIRGGSEPGDRFGAVNERGRPTG